MGIPLVCRKTILALCIVQDAHAKLGHGRYVLQLLHNILSEFYIPGVKKMIIQLKKSCLGCLGFQRTIALRGIPRIIWIDTGLNIVKSGKDLVQSEVKVVSELNIKFAAIEFRATLPKHHYGNWSCRESYRCHQEHPQQGLHWPQPAQDGRRRTSHLAEHGYR